VKHLLPRPLVVVLPILAGLVPPLVAQKGADEFWPQWRGPQMSGVSASATPPAEWSESKNVRWKIEIPGRGSASPVVWGDRVFLLTAVPAGGDVGDPHAPRGGLPVRGVHRFVIMAINRKDGKVVWQQTAREAEPHEASHNDNGTWASSSAITDGEHVIAPFESQGIYAYDMNGKLVWQKDLGDKYMRNTFGEGSTPALHKDRLFYVWDHQKESFIIALDKRTGRELWRVRRDEIDTWATPLVVEHGGVTQVIVPGMNRVRSYDAATGQIVWETAGLTMNPVPSPVWRRNGVPDERLPRQQPESGEAGWCEGGHHQHTGRRMDDGSGHALRAFTSLVRGHSVLPENQQRIAHRRRCEDREAALPGTADRRSAERVCVAGGRSREDLRGRTGRGNGSHQAGTDPAGRRHEHA
jgi:outer membrane protein assembly factor BamB